MLAIILFKYKNIDKNKLQTKKEVAIFNISMVLYVNT